MGHFPVSVEQVILHPKGLQNIKDYMLFQIFLKECFLFLSGFCNHMFTFYRR